MSLFTIAVMTLCTLSAQAKTDKPNILVIMTDDVAF